MILTLALAGCGGSGSATTPAPTATPARGAAYAAHTIYVGANPSQASGEMVALNAQTGASRWSFSMGATYTTPVITTPMLYTASQDGYLYALDASTGTQVWRFQRSSQVDGYPTLANGVVYVTSDDGSVNAVDAKTGALQWTYTMPNSNDHLYSAPAVAQGLVFFGAGGADNGLYALDAATGKLRWRGTLPGKVQASPLAS